MLYLYAFVPHQAGAVETTGIGEIRPTVVPLGTVAAVVADVEGAIDSREEHVLAHARVVDALAASNDAVLPVRFGRGFRDVDDLEQAVSRILPELEERLEDVKGCVELGLHVVAAPQPTAAASSGREYMQRRLRDLSHAEALAEEIYGPLAARARAATRTHGVGASALLRAAYLLPETHVAAFRAAVEEGQRAHPELAFACTGPWPPYSFAALEPEEAVA